VKRAHKKQWKDTCVEITTTWCDSDTQVLKNSEDFSEHFAYMLSDGRRKNEVNTRSLSDSERHEFHGAKKLEADQWISNAVFTVAKRAGIPKNRIMAMRWILTWKKVEGSDKQKAKASWSSKGLLTLT